MSAATTRTICWRPLWNEAQPGVGLEHLVLTERQADALLLAIDEDGGAFRLGYRLSWDAAWRLRHADLSCVRAGVTTRLRLRSDGAGHWHDADGSPRSELDGCIDIDIWPTPFTNSFPILRDPLALGERRTYLMAWVSAPSLSVVAQPQAYTRLAERRYLFENLDGSGFRVELAVDDAGVVLDYPALFERVPVSR